MMSERTAGEAETFEDLAKEAILEIDPDEVHSPALRRLIQDIQQETPAPSAYNRMHNRHNRGR